MQVGAYTLPCCSGCSDSERAAAAAAAAALILHKSIFTFTFTSEQHEAAWRVSEQFAALAVSVSRGTYREQETQLNTRQQKTRISWAAGIVSKHPNLPAKEQEFDKNARKISKIPLR